MMSFKNSVFPWGQTIVSKFKRPRDQRITHKEYCALGNLCNSLPAVCWKKSSVICFMETVFVFGSNLAGRHGKGAALHARKHHGTHLWPRCRLQGSMLNRKVQQASPTCRTVG